MFTKIIQRMAHWMVVFLFALSLSGFQAAPETTLTFTVNTTLDQRDLATNGVCSIGTPVGGACTLRAAISEAIGNLPYEDVQINIPAGNYLLTLPPDATNNIHTGDLDLPASDSPFTVTITGTDALPAIIDANQLDRVFRIGAGVHVSIHNVVIRGGIVRPTDANPFGAGIANHGYLALTNIIVEDNKGDCSPVACNGTPAGAGIAHLGQGYLSIVDSTIQNNLAYNGAAIYNDNAQISMRNSTVAGNHSVGGYNIVNHGNLDLLNSTIANNSAGENVSPGIYNTSALKIRSSTLFNPGPIAGVLNVQTGSVTIQDSLMAAYPGSFASNCDPSSEGAWISIGFNIYSDNTCPLNLAAGDLQNTNPLFGPLGNWGGPTQTVPLLPASPALNHRPSPCLLPLGPLTIDQRYFPRNDAMCDSGAFEGFVKIYQANLPLIKR